MTELRYQPLEPLVPDSDAVVVGGVLSTTTEWVALFVRPALSWTSNREVYAPSAGYACAAVGAPLHPVSQVPSFVQSQRNCRVEFGSGSVEVDASNETVAFTRGHAGEYVNRAVGPPGRELVKNSLMFGAFWSFDVRWGRFQFASRVDRSEKWLYDADDVKPVFATGPAQTV